MRVAVYWPDDETQCENLRRAGRWSAPDWIPSGPWSPAVNRRLQAGVFLVVAVVTGAAGFFFNRSSLVSPATQEAVQRLMQGSLPDLNGKPQTFSQWHGQVLVVNFWATWCVPCREEIPALRKVQRQFAPNGVKIVGIALDNAAKVREYADEMHVDYVLLIGAAGNWVWPRTWVIVRVSFPLP